MIPMGQPILVGHHSERHHRNHIEQIDNNMRKSIDSDKKADYYDDRAKSAASNTAISSDNPDAVRELRKKIERLEKEQQLYKAVNKICLNKKLSDVDKVEKLLDLNFKDHTALEFVTGALNYGRPGVPKYVLTKNNANIRTAKKRLEQIQKVAALQYEEMDYADGTKIILDPDKNRIQIVFTGKPSDDIRTELKSNGFKWSPNEGAWQRMISNSASYHAKRIVSSMQIQES
jgi:hypothetical protein